MSKFPPFFPRPDCLPIRRRVQNGGVHLDTCLIPLCLESSSSVEFGSRKPPLENPLTHTTNSLPAPSARPPQVARRGLFLSAIFRTHPGPSLEPPEYRIGSRKPPLENPLMHTTNSLPAPFARPPSGPGEGGFFCQRFFARLKLEPFVGVPSRQILPRSRVTRLSVGTSAASTTAFHARCGTSSERRRPRRRC